MDLGLAGRTALVMGASRGIGRAIASALAREGARVGIASRSRERIEEAAAAIGAGAPDGAARVAPFVADATDLKRLAALPAEVETEIGPLDVIVANAGGPPFGGALEHGLEEWEGAYRSLVLAPMVLAEAVVPGMRERGWGRIVNVGSTSTREPIPGLNLSNAHRMAAVGFLKTLSREVAGDGITIHQHRRHRPLRNRAAGIGRRLTRGGRSRRKGGSPGGPPRPARGVRRPRRLPLLRARRIHHRDGDPDRRRPPALSLRASPASTGRGSRRAASSSR
jgi:3-oxoacyl-[acyl-carrier protein] reductase